MYPCQSACQRIVLLGPLVLALGCDQHWKPTQPPSYPGPDSLRSYVVSDWQYVERKYFLLQLPDSLANLDGELRSDAPRIHGSSVQVFYDDNIDKMLPCELLAYAERWPPREGSALDDVALIGRFDCLEPWADYTVRFDLFGPDVAVLILANPIPDSYTLAVRYRDTYGVVGGTRNDTLRLQLLKVPPSYHVMIGGRYTDDPELDRFASLREYELRNFYALGYAYQVRQITRIRVQRLLGGEAAVADRFTDPRTQESITYLEVTGLDLLDQSEDGSATAGQDEMVDSYEGANWISEELGVLCFPDLRPFAPRLDRPGDRYFFRSRVPLSPLPTRRRTLSSQTGATLALRANPDAYDLRNRALRREAETFSIVVEYRVGYGPY